MWPWSGIGPRGPCLSLTRKRSASSLIGAHRLPGRCTTGTPKKKRRLGGSVDTSVDLVSILGNVGITSISERRDEIWAPCPQHIQRVGHPDKRPSWSINTKTYVHFCLSCGYKGSLQQLLIDITG